MSSPKPDKKPRGKPTKKKAAKKKAASKAKTAKKKPELQTGWKAAEIQRELRRTKVARLYARGKTQVEIAEILDVAYRTVQNDMDRIRERWREAYVDDFIRGVVDELAKLDEVWAAAWRGWRRSLKDAEMNESGDNHQGSFTKRRRTGQAGDSSFLAQMTNVSRLRLQALGALAEAKRQQEQQRGRYGDGYEIVTVVIEDRTQASQAMTLPHFRHQFAGYEDTGADSPESTQELIAQQVDAIGSNGDHDDNGQT